MEHREISELLKFMGTPMAKIQGTGRTHFKRIATCNMLKMQFSATFYEVLHGWHISLSKHRSIFFQPLKESTIFYQCYFNCFRNTGSPMPLIQRMEKMIIIKNNGRWCECAEVIFLSEKVDPVLYADTRIVL